MVSVRLKAKETVRKHSCPVDKDVPSGVQINSSDTAIHLYLNSTVKRMADAKSQVTH